MKQLSIPLPQVNVFSVVWKDSMQSKADMPPVFSSLFKKFDKPIHGANKDELHYYQSFNEHVSNHTFSRTVLSLNCITPCTKYECDVFSCSFSHF